MVKRFWVPLVIAISLAVSAHAVSNPNEGYDPGTGDKDLDITLCAINEDAYLSLGKFFSDMSASYNVPQDRVISMMTVDKMKLSDIFMALKISSLTKKPCEFVLGRYKKDRDKGWGVIARGLGIKPDSAQFREIKDDANAVLSVARSRRQEMVESARKAKARIDAAFSKSGDKGTIDSAQEFSSGR